MKPFNSLAEIVCSLTRARQQRQEHAPDYNNSQFTMNVCRESYLFSMVSTAFSVDCLAGLAGSTSNEYAYCTTAEGRAVALQRSGMEIIS